MAAFSALEREVARDLSEQIAPVPTQVYRRVYTNTSANSARHFHNLAVAAEADGRVDDALPPELPEQALRSRKLMSAVVRPSAIWTTMETPIS